MTTEWSVPVWAVLATLGTILLLLGGVLLLVRRSAARADRALASAQSSSAELRAQVSAIEQQLARRVQPQRDGSEPADEREYVITNLGVEGALADEPVGSSPAVDGPLFADLVLRESVVQAASLAAGLRRALAPERLNRIRFEMRREVKRARKQRRADLRQARREFEARQRTGVDLDEKSAA